MPAHDPITLSAHSGTRGVSPRSGRIHYLGELTNKTGRNKPEKKRREEKKG